MELKALHTLSNVLVTYASCDPSTNQENQKQEIWKVTHKAKDIEEIQWSAKMYTFDNIIDLVEEKYVKSKVIDNTVIESLEDFFSYFRST